MQVHPQTQIYIQDLDSWLLPKGNYHWGWENNDNTEEKRPKDKKKKKKQRIGNNEDTDQNRGKITQMSRVSTVYELVGWVGEETGMGAVQWGLVL